MSYVLFTSYVTPLKHRRVLCFLLLKRRAEMEKVVWSYQILEPSPILGPPLDIVLVPEKRQDDAFISTVFLRHHTSKWCHGLYTYALSLASHLPLTTCLKPLFVRLLWEP